MHADGVEGIGGETDQRRDQQEQQNIRFPLKGGDGAGADEEKDGKAHEITPGIDGPAVVISVELAGKDRIERAEQTAHQTDDDAEDHRRNAEDLEVRPGGDGVNIREVDDADDADKNQCHGDDLGGGEWFLQHEAAQQNGKDRQGIEEHRGHGGVDVVNGAVIADGNKAEAQTVEDELFQMFPFDFEYLLREEDPVDQDQDRRHHAADRRHHPPGQSDAEQQFADDGA